MRTIDSKELFLFFTVVLFLLRVHIGTAAENNQDAKSNEASENPTAEQLRDGHNFMEIKTYTQEQDQKILNIYEGLRVSDVSDGMDKAGLANVGLMSPEIHPAWKDTEHFTHRFVGIAVTVRYIPTNESPTRGDMTIDEFDEWIDNTYANVTPEPFLDIIRPGTALVFDDDPSKDAGSIGSHNIMEWQNKGCVGVVTSGGARDTDEVAAQKNPLYMKTHTRGIRPGRNILESVNRPIACGGVLVRPGDVIVADGDGVIVVPREKATEVAEYALVTKEGDKAGRRRLYEELGIDLDDSVK